MKDDSQELREFVPKQPRVGINWEEIEHSGLRPVILDMKKTLQNPLWHGEGDVWTHTRMVCEELVGLKTFWEQAERIRQELFLAALLHDVGKIPCTRMEDGAWVSPGHTLAGSRMARELLWLEYGFCGTRELQNFRETVCTLIRYHMAPLHLADQKDPERRLLKIASDGELAEDFTLERLGILAEADIRGRIMREPRESLDWVELYREEAERLGCLREPFFFADSYSQYAYLNGKDILPGQKLYDDTWGEVILPAGLPGSGKDSWIGKFCGDLPVISLDEIRKELHILPTESQGAVIQAARERAKEYLRKKAPFVWNATNLSPMVREKQISLFTDYRARVRIVYLETEWEEELRRNEGRADVVPEKAIRGMMKHLILPERFEAHKVEWKCV